MSCPSVSVAEQCLNVIAFGVDQLHHRDHRGAEKAFGIALLALHQGVAAGECNEMRALALYNVALSQMRQGRTEEARQVREQAALLASHGGSGGELSGSSKLLLQELMADVLTEVGEYVRALPYCEASMRNIVELEGGQDSAASVMWRAGKCYMRIGLRDHAAVPLRAAVKVLRMLAGDPRLPAVLLDLGSALRKSSPAEAEQAYREVADIHVSRGQLESATPAWVNLGVLCSEQGRYAESLEYYEKALRVREQSTGTPPQRIGSLLNNMANVYRRMGKFEEALGCANRAVEYLKSSGGHYLACGYGTRGLIFRDWGKDEDAVEAFRTSAAEHRKQPSPNLETLSEELENEAAALERLGRTEEAETARQGIEKVRASMRDVGAVGNEVGEVRPPAEGAVLIELDFGSRSAAGSGVDPSVGLKWRLARDLQESGRGYCGGHVVIPETTTLIYYGADAEAIFEQLQPRLLEDPLCAGARITVRQGETHREVFLPSRLM